MRTWATPVNASDAGMDNVTDGVTAYVAPALIVTEPDGGTVSPTGGRLATIESLAIADQLPWASCHWTYTVLVPPALLPPRHRSVSDQRTVLGLPSSGSASRSVCCTPASPSRSSSVGEFEMRTPVTPMLSVAVRVMLTIRLL